MIGFLKQYLDVFVFGILGTMSFLMVWFVLERLLFYRALKLDSFRHQEKLNIALTRHLTLISTIGANAPYVGLLGTVLGVLITFHDIGTSDGNIDASSIMVGLALALKATALGLMVAIPAIWSYNALLRKVEVITAEWRTVNGLGEQSNQQTHQQARQQTNQQE